MKYKLNGLIFEEYPGINSTFHTRHPLKYSDIILEDDTLIALGAEPVEDKRYCQYCKVASGYKNCNVYECDCDCHKPEEDTSEEIEPKKIEPIEVYKQDDYGPAIMAIADTLNEVIERLNND